MPDLRLLPGEREEASLRPTPWSHLPSYLRGASFAVWGLALWVLFRSSWWHGHDPAGPWWRVWTHLYGNAPAGYVLMLLGLVVGGAAFAWAVARPWWWGALLGSLLGGAVTLLSVGVFGNAYATAAPLLLVGASVLAWGLVETDRRLRRIRFTNLRCVAHGGLWGQAETSVRYEDIADLDVHQGPLGRLLDYGDLLPVLARHARDGEDAGAPRIEGVRPLREGRELLAAMVQHATAGAGLRRAADTESRLYRALRRFSS